MTWLWQDLLRLILQFIILILTILRGIELLILISGFIFAAAMMIYRSMFFAGLLYLLTLPVAILAVKSANKKDLATSGKFKANQMTVILHAAGSLALTIGFIIMGLI